MRRRFWGALNRAGLFVEHIGRTVRDYAWSRYWYGPNGVGTERHPHLANVPPASLAECWRREVIWA